MIKIILIYCSALCMAYIPPYFWIPLDESIYQTIKLQLFKLNSDPVWSPNWNLPMNENRWWWWGRRRCIQDITDKLYTAVQLAKEICGWIVQRMDKSDVKSRQLWLFRVHTEDVSDSCEGQSFRILKIWHRANIETSFHWDHGVVEEILPI